MERCKNAFEEESVLVDPLELVLGLLVLQRLRQLPHQRVQRLPRDLRIALLKECNHRIMIARCCTAPIIIVWRVRVCVCVRERERAENVEWTHCVLPVVVFSLSFLLGLPLHGHQIAHHIALFFFFSKKENTNI